jgi:hypothetical protein
MPRAGFETATPATTDLRLRPRGRWDRLIINTCTKKQSHNTLVKAQGERMYSSYSFTTSALDGGERSASRPGRVLPPGKDPPVPIGQEVGWAPEPVWTQRLGEKSFALPGIEPR